MNTTCAGASPASFRNARGPFVIVLHWSRICYSLATVLSLAALSLDVVLDLEDDDDDLSFSFLLSLEEEEEEGCCCCLALMESINRADPINNRYPAIPTPTIRKESAH